jgi:hypothetical protein
MPRSAVYLYEDEAGNYDFTACGSRYFIMTCVIMRRPFGHCENLLNLKYDCIEDGYNQKNVTSYLRFHATEDLQFVRDSVYAIIGDNLDRFTIYSVIIPKNDLIPIQDREDEIYAKGFSSLVDLVARHEDFSEASKLVVITDTIPVKKKRGAIEGSLKAFLKRWSEKTGVPYLLNHHSSESDLNLQVADYACWAIQRKWERNDLRSYELIKAGIVSESLIKETTVPEAECDEIVPE